jgi:hypothetical protein
MLTIEGRMGTFLRCGLGDLKGLLSLLGPFIERHAGAILHRSCHPIGTGHGNETGRKGAFTPSPARTLKKTAPNRDITTQ